MYLINNLNLQSHWVKLSNKCAVLQVSLTIFSCAAYNNLHFLGLWAVGGVGGVLWKGSIIMFNAAVSDSATKWFFTLMPNHKDPGLSKTAKTLLRQERFLSSSGIIQVFKVVCQTSCKPSLEWNFVGLWDQVWDLNHPAPETFIPPSGASSLRFWHAPQPLCRSDHFLHHRWVLESKH